MGYPLSVSVQLHPYVWSYYCMKRGYIYKLTLKRDIEHFTTSDIYIGKHDGSDSYYYTGGILPTKIIKKYGKDIFIREILARDIEDESLLAYMEMYYISLYKCNRIIHKSGLNLTNGGDGTKGHRHTAETIKRISEIKVKKREYGIRYNVKKIYQYDRVTGNFIREFNSVSEAAKSIKCTSCSISPYATGKKGNVAKGYAWSYIKYDKIEIDTRRRREIIQYDKENNIVKIWESSAEAEEVGKYYMKSVIKACKTGKPYKKYTWKYKHEVYKNKRWLTK